MIEILKAISDETRLRIFAQIIKGDMCVCEIEECLGLTQSNASRHLSIMKKAGILDSYKKAQWAYFKVSEKFISQEKELYEYLISHLSEIAGYEEDCKNYNNCKACDLCNCMEKEKGE